MSRKFMTLKFMSLKYKRRLFSLIVMIGTPLTAMAQSSQEIGTYRWEDGCKQEGKVCGSQKYRDGLALLTLIVNGISVDVVLVDTGKLTIVAAVVGNNTKHPIDVIPELFTLQVTESRNLKLYDPEELSKKMGKEAQSDASWMMTASALATSRMTSQAGPGGDSPASDDSGNIVAGTRSRYATRPREATKPKGLALDRASARVEEGASAAEMVSELAMRAESVPAQSAASGLVFFESDKKVGQLLLKIPAGGYVFEFPFVRR
jgi:hypothetical protein